MQFDHDYRHRIRVSLNGNWIIRRNESITSTFSYGGRIHIIQFFIRWGTKLLSSRLVSGWMWNKHFCGISNYNIRLLQLNLPISRSWILFRSTGGVNKQLVKVALNLRLIKADYIMQWQLLREATCQTLAPKKRFDDDRRKHSVTRDFITSSTDLPKFRKASSAEWSCDVVNSA